MKKEYSIGLSKSCPHCHRRVLNWNPNTDVVWCDCGDYAED